ncbi:potassium-transporting ATPase subunit KdpC [Novosphingobium album (ex Liu et al. 2023)]|uniref:Potassium-transporting ATPase KdpC subunit n=1 Tax=Novosphingobium album (ex Liu et al. 2023) TaxID=3031130 RepID=A0ABT5WU94_9SPHN|nr:potassium-transporting ATPase subunit KdpC [Novosphingobium album (ex Liu et al. 2023)]MDE8653447.1 potassium-transporting ATPase subunit KdpC [Novosphingobium album (ex Liu et al. 2023)]
MLNDFSSALRPALVLTVLFALLLGIAYPLALTGVGQLVFPRQANGSLLRDGGGRVIGSDLIGQSFTAPGYFHGRPSAAGTGYDASASSGSNLGPASQVLADRVTQDLATLRGEQAGKVAPDQVTASASGLDPHISPEAALFQAPRVARARGLPVARVTALVGEHREGRLLGVLGEPRVNVLELNQALDSMAGTGAQARP